MKKLTSAQETIRAAALSRRTLMKSAVALGAIGLTGPLYVKSGLASSGEAELHGLGRLSGAWPRRCSRPSPPPPASR